MKSIIVLVCVIYSFRIYAQTTSEIEQIRNKTNVGNLIQLSRTYTERHLANKNKAFLMAAKNKWPLKIKKNGVYVDLIGLTDALQPLYVEPLDKNAIITARANYLYLGGGLGLNLHGESMTAGVWDVAGTYTYHEAFENRIVQIDNSPIIKTGPNASLSNHATAVSGILIGSNIFKNGNASGVAFKANVHAYDANDDLSEVALAASNGLLISNHSYGGGTSSSYGSQTSSFDEIMYNAPYFLTVWACGNSGGPTDKLNPYSVVKNGLAVANTNAVLNYTGPSSVRIGDQYGVGPSRGPSDDGRIKPDISVRGTTVYPYYVSSTGVNYYAESPPDTSSSTTSTASPTVAGVLLLLQQHFKNVNGSFMKASTLKALSLHTADECGPNPGPDITFGWGLINAKRAANVITDNGGTSYISEDSLATGGVYSREFVASGTEPLVATICWTDIPGASTAIDNDPTPKLVNDLDLRIINNATTFYPWRLNLLNVTGPAVQADNDRDNIEKIEISNPVAGQIYTLNINHKGTLSGNGQRFSVIVTGLKECVENRSISSSVNAISIDHQQASATILATNTINTSAEAIYHAGDQVLMTNGFTAINGSIYRAYIESCTNDYAARKAVTERPVVTYEIPFPKVENVLADHAVYPNPGNGIFNVRVTGLIKGTIQVVDIKGKEFFNTNFKEQDQININIKDGAPGIYIVRVVSDGKVYSKTIAKY